MRQIRQFFKYKYLVSNWQIKLFFRALLGTTLITYINAIFVFLPPTVLGFNWSGIAWISALIICLILYFNVKPSTFPLLYWVPWIIYISIYVVFDFSFFGLQLTLQYLLPIFMGYLAASFRYSVETLLWILQGLVKISIFIYLLTISYILVLGWAPNQASTPMFLLILGAICLGLFFTTKKTYFLIVFAMLFLMPFLGVTRMAMLVFALTFITHFSNTRIISKIGAVFFGGLMLLGVSNSKGFQEKTFNNGAGEISELSVNYYDSDNFNSNGRKSWKSALESGIESAPVFGNGPRSDASVLGAILGKEIGEAHNDFMSIRFNYGFVGLTFLLLGFGASFFKMYRMLGDKKEKVFQLLIRTNLTLFIGFLLFMYSDNILKYTIWFPNYFFVLIGICFSIYKKGFEIDKPYH